ncbi:MAG: hypothetical protein ACFCU3_06025 [Verrucomicrobiales bacterium]
MIKLLALAAFAVSTLALGACAKKETMSMGDAPSATFGYSK